MVKFAAKHRARKTISKTKSKNIKVTVQSHESLETFCSKAEVQNEWKKVVSITDNKIAASVHEGRNLARNPDQGTAAASDWTYHFFSSGKNIVRYSDWRTIFFTYEKHCSLLWLAKTHLRVKIFWQRFSLSSLSMYIINPSTLSCIVRWLARTSSPLEKGLSGCVKTSSTTYRTFACIKLVEFRELL